MSWDTETALALYRKGLSDRKISEAVGVSDGTVRNWRFREGLPTNHPKKRKEKLT